MRLTSWRQTCASPLTCACPLTDVLSFTAHSLICDAMMQWCNAVQCSVFAVVQLPDSSNIHALYIYRIFFIYLPPSNFNHFPFPPPSLSFFPPPRLLFLPPLLPPSFHLCRPPLTSTFPLCPPPPLLHSQPSTPFPPSILPLLFYSLWITQWLQHPLAWLSHNRSQQRHPAEFLLSASTLHSHWISTGLAQSSVHVQMEPGEPEPPEGLPAGT